jgi:hypothetical protein
MRANASNGGSGGRRVEEQGGDGGRVWTPTSSGVDIVWKGGEGALGMGLIRLSAGCSFSLTSSSHLQSRFV